jgi:hypothetical protein
VTNSRFHGLREGASERSRQSSETNRSSNCRTASRWHSSPDSSCGYGIVIEPRSQVALMRDPRVSVAGRYFVWIACMILNRAVIARHSLPGDR